jgi:flagellar biosynthetic protein FliO
LTVFGSLGLVLGLFLAVAWVARRGGAGGGAVLPREAFEVLGRATLAPRQQVHLVRVGGRLLLVSVSPAGAETLTEISDATEVERITGLCSQAQPGSISTTFRDVLTQMGSQRPGRRWFGRGRNEDADLVPSARLEPEARDV